MSAAARSAGARNPGTSRLAARRLLRALLPSVSLALVLVAVGLLNPRAISYFGFNLMLNLAIPIALATVAQMFVITVNDLDLSIGFFVSFIGCVAATWLTQRPVWGAAMILGGIVVYGLIGALTYLRNLPSIVVTLGMSFVWQGAAIILLPQPGGAAPDWLSGLMSYRVPFVPFPIVAAVVIALVTHVGLMRTAFGAVLRGAGGNPQAVESAGWSLLSIKVVAFTLAGLFGVLSGLSLVGIATAADPSVGSGYTLLSIAGVILGGGEFVGVRVSPSGAVIGALTLALASGSLLSFLHLSPDWQIGANGLILIVILAARALINRTESAA